MLKILKIEKNSSKEFWLSHIIILFATIFGVYLAASSGFKQAVKFENVVSDKNVYYMQQSIITEVNNNIKLIKEVGNNFIEGRNYFKNKHLVLDMYMWNALKYSPDSFEIRSDILGDIRRFYVDAQIMIDKIKTTKASSAQFSDLKLVRDTISHANKLQENAMKTMTLSVKKIEKSLLKNDVNL